MQEQIFAHQLETLAPELPQSSYVGTSSSSEYFHQLRSAPIHRPLMISHEQTREAREKADTALIIRNLADGLTAASLSAPFIRPPTVQNQPPATQNG